MSAAGWSASRWGYRSAVDTLCVTNCYSLDAPLFIPAGGCFNLSPMWWPGDESPQMVVQRGEK